VYELATLKQAFHARDMNSLVYRVLHGKVCALAAILRKVGRIPDVYSTELADMVAAMMDKNPGTSTKQATIYALDNRPAIPAMLKLKFVRHNIAVFLGRCALRPS
jgi:NIMA (never in mitosis gene a)-related kinase